MLYSKSFLTAGLLAAACLTCESAAASNKVLLSKIQSLTVRNGKMTTHRRVPAAQQLECVGGSAKGLYEVDTMRCTNEGFEYNEKDVQWTCKATIPEDFRLGSTDVQCEGYASPDDPYVLKGSCGVSYTLVLTDKGEAKYGKRPNHGGNRSSGGDGDDNLWRWIFIALFVGVIVWMVYSANNNRRLGREERRPENRGGWGGGGGGNDDNNDPPPPYTPYGSVPKGSGSNQSNSQGQGFRPGFWSGLMGGAAAGGAGGYYAGRRSNPRTPLDRYRDDQSSRSSSRSNSWNNGEGSSRSQPTPSSTTHSSTGFGSTSRR